MSIAPTSSRSRALALCAALSLGCAALSLGCAGETATTRADDRELPTEQLAAHVELDVGVGEAGEVVLALRNTGPHGVQLPRGYARLDVRRDGEPVRACTQERLAWTPIPTRGVWLAPGGAHRFSMPLDCAIGSTGEHTLLVDLVLGDQVDPTVPAPGAEYLAASGTFDAERLPEAPS